MSKTLKILLIIAVPLIIFLVVAKKMGWIGKEEGVKIELVKVEKSTLTETVFASGKIQPEVEVKISSEVSGEVIELPIEEGQKVEKGELLVKINPDIYLAAVNRALASVNSTKSQVGSAKAQLIEAEKIYNRNKKLYSQKVISDAEFDNIQRAFDVAKLNVEASEYQLKSAQATENEARDNLARTTIYAPQSGTISMLNIEEGERVVGTAQMAGTEIMRLANLEAMEVLIEVNENDIIRVNLNDTALIEVDAYLGEEFVGLVTEIANSAKIQGLSTDQVTNFEVKVRILKDSYAKIVKPGQSSPFRPGMTASVEIQTQRKSDVLTIPINAVTTRTDTSTKAKSYKVGLNKEDENEEIFEVVFVFQDGEAKLRLVKTGIQDEENIEILEGLEFGEEVIEGPYNIVSKKLVNGMKVEEKSDYRSKNKDNTETEE
tara:strand:- start:52501 stop:53796 length:1296 start_codon:yes stop_codon:yes gene_type:complete